MKRYVLLYKDNKKNEYNIVDLYTSRKIPMKFNEMCEKVKSGSIDIENVNIVDGRLVVTKFPEKLGNNTYLIAQYADWVLVVDCIVDCDVDIIDKESVYNMCRNSVQAHNILKETIEITDINEKVEKYNVKSKFIGQNIILFPIDKDRCMLKVWGMNHKPIKIPKYCSILNSGHSIDSQTQNMYTIQPKVVPCQIQSGFEYVEYINASFFNYGSDINVSKFTSLIEIGNRAFSRNKTDEIIIPKTCVAIGNEAFYKSEAKRIVIESNEIMIGSHAFAGCEKLKSVVITGKAEIGHGAFISCYALESVELSDTIEYIPDSCFAECSRLKEIKIPKNIRKIEYTSFSGNTCLERVIISNNSLRIPNIKDWVVDLKLDNSDVVIINTD